MVNINCFCNIPFFYSDFEDIFTNPLEHIAIDREEQWLIWIHSLSDTGEPLEKTEISMIVYGTKGKTPLLEIENMNNTPFEVSFLLHEREPFKPF